MKSWLSSPLITNYLLSLYENGTPFQKKYVQIYRNIKNKKPCKFRNRLFVPTSHNVEKYKTSHIEIENVQFENSNEASQRVLTWITQYETFKEVDIVKHVLPNPPSLLINISEFKGTWSMRGPAMKVHNSFSYTEDIKYEARLLELPMQDDFKLALVVPNEVESIRGLFRTLATEGLDAAISCVQPLFTQTTMFEAPSIEFSSESRILNETDCDICNGVQLGNVQINENGTYISILTCLGSTYTNPVPVEESTEQKSAFYFAVLYKDTAIFTGRYVN